MVFSSRAKGPKLDRGLPVWDARAAHCSPRPTRGRAPDSSQAAAAANNRNEAPRGPTRGAASFLLLAFKARKNRSIKSKRLGSRFLKELTLSLPAPALSPLQTRKKPDSLVANRLPDCDVVEIGKKRRERVRNEVTRETKRELEKLPFFLASFSLFCCRWNSFFVGAHSPSDLPRMDEEVDAVLETRAVGATTAERAAMACIVREGRRKIWGGKVAAGRSVVERV